MVGQPTHLYVNEFQFLHFNLYQLSFSNTLYQVLAVEAITTLLLQSTLTPTSGDTLHSVFEHHPRHHSLPDALQKDVRVKKLGEKKRIPLRKESEL